MHNASLLALDGKTPKDVADGSATVLAVSADATHVAVLRASGTVGLYSPAGKSLLNVSPPSARAVAVGGRNLVILENDGTLAVYDSGTGSIRKTFHLQGNRKNLQALAVHGNDRGLLEAPALQDRCGQRGCHPRDQPHDRQGPCRGPARRRDHPGEHRLRRPRVRKQPLRRFQAGGGTVVFVPFAKVAAAVS